MFLTRKHLKTFLTNLTISSIVTAAVLLFTAGFISGFKPLEKVELSSIDFRFRLRGVNSKIHDSSKVIIVEISQETFKSLPEKWPWPRTYFSRLIRNLKRAGAKAVGIDILFGSGDTRTKENDEDFRKALKEVGNVVLAGQLQTENPHYTLLDSSENYGNFYIEKLSSIGLVNTRLDPDNNVRRYLPFGVETAREKRIPMFSLAVLNLYLNNEASYTPEITEDAFQFHDISIPKYDPAAFLINYYGPSGTFRRMKFVDIIDDKDFTTVEEASLQTEINTFDDPDIGYLYNDTFKDKIVLVGSTMPEDKDLFSVPIGEGKLSGDNQMYGVEIHANVIQNILDKNFIYSEPLWLKILIVFILSLFTFTIISGLKGIKMRFSFLTILGLMIILAEAALVIGVSIKLFNSFNYLADMMSPLLAVAVSYGGSTVYNYMTERKQKVMIKNMFSHYVNKDVVNELIDHPEKLRLTGDRREMTVMFTDIENFTALAEKMKAEELVTVLNDYLNEMTSIIFTNGGTVDKYEGDAVMAFWGAPLLQENHALFACKAAIEMQTAIASIRQQWVNAGRKPINVRIGINTGEMIVGNIGGSGKYEYTVIGDSVNLGSRLEGANKQYRTNIMISESTYNKVKDRILARELDMIIVAGKTQPIRVYDLLGLIETGIPADQFKFIEYYNNGLKLYREREWKMSIKQFEKALEMMPKDYPSQIYIERSHLYQASPPPDDWNGVFILRTK